jgi:hypothetical protein
MSMFAPQLLSSPDPDTQFRRARRRARRSRRGRPSHLSDAAGLHWAARPRLRTIPLDAIVGTVDPTADFDACFRPASDRVAARWRRVARAHGEGRSLPPIEVIERPDGFYVLDGRHRVSVARAFDQGEIEAWTSRAAA